MPVNMARLIRAVAMGWYVLAFSLSFSSHLQIVPPCMTLNPPKLTNTPVLRLLRYQSARR